MTPRLLATGALIVLSSLTATAGPAELSLPADVDRAEAAITGDDLVGHVVFLSDDLLEGRAPASRGGLLGRRYIESALRGLGLDPGMGDGGYEQPFEMVGVTSHAPSTWTFRAGDAELTLERREQFVAWSGRQHERAALADAEIVFVGYGITAPEHGWDDFKDADLHGKVLLMLNNDPDWDPELFEGRRRLYYGRWDYKYENAARQGAAGAILIHTRPSAGYPWQVVQTSWTGEQFRLPGNDGGAQVEAWIAETAANRLVAMSGRRMEDLVAAARRRDFRPVPLGITTSLAVTSELRRVGTANVLGLLPGSDPDLRDEVVVYTAHHDHIGIGEPDATGDAIYNGALDNASGVAQLLAIARAFKSLELPPRRSVLFLAVAAEEQGLLGSAHYATHPTFPAAKIAANVNIDGANIWGRTADVALIGYGKSGLDRIAEAARLAFVCGLAVANGDQLPRWNAGDEFESIRLRSLGQSGD